MPGAGRPRPPSTAAALLLAAIAAAAYLNTLTAQFTFDDSFAVLYNGDVTDREKPLSAILRNDFWGQELRSPMSHKSYRPLTILSFRLQHRLGGALLGEAPADSSSSGGGGGGARVPTPLSSRVPPGRDRVSDAKREGSSAKPGHSANPLPFHVCNVLAHAGVTVLVYRLARRLAAVRRGGGSNSSGSSDSSSSSSSSWATELEPFIAALLFALHPVHTEAVAGVVGHAELLCAALSIPALLCYMAAADGGAGSTRAHWAHVAAAMALGWAAALTKEIGITIMGAMVCYDVLVAPLVPPPPLRSPAAAKHRRAQPPPQPPLQEPPHSARKVSPASSARAHAHAASAAAVAAAATELLQFATAVANGGGGGDPAARRRGLVLKLQRMAVAAAAVLLYVKARSFLAGDQLVRIYRKVENPIPFAGSSLTRKLTTGYLHARYAGLLLAPVQLSADWSYACIEYVSGLWDPRNLATLALYAALLHLALAARPWDVLREWAGKKTAAPSQGEHERRWRLAVAAGLLVGPFFPASNVLFYVGTFIGERLLYFPSVGYCILLAQPLAAALLPLVERLQAAQGSSGDSKGDDSSGSARPSRRRRAGAALVALLLAGMLAFYAVRTVTRNEDWRDEERLFRAAQQVCWRSGKVQLNSGIVERRYQNWEKAEMHFRLARAADPEGFCEPDFHIGLTLLSRNLTQAIEYLELGVGCKYTAADSVKGLNQIFQQLLESSPSHASEVMERWGAVLARPELQRYTEAATYFENAALKAKTPLQAVIIINRAQALLSQARPVEEGRTPQFPVRVPAAPAAVALLARCVSARRPVILAMVGSGDDRHGLASRSVKHEAYRYLAEHGAECRAPMPALEADPEDVAARSVTFHMGLMHALQQADVNDPWVQQEWGLILVAEGRTQEALAHLEVAGHIFAAQLQPPEEALEKGLKPGTVLNAAGEHPISAAEAAEAAVAAYRLALEAVEALSAQAGAAADATTWRKAVCRLLQHACSVRQQQLAQAGQGDAHRRAEAALAACLEQAVARGCTAADGKAAAAGWRRSAARSVPAASDARDEL